MNEHLTFALIPMVTMGLAAAWVTYLWRLEKKTINRINKFCDSGQHPSVAEAWSTKKTPKEYHVYAREKERVNSVGEGKEVTVLGFSLAQALRAYYYELRRKHATAKLEPIALISMEKLSKK